MADKLDRVVEAAPILAAHRWIIDGKGVALATVIATWGSSPRPTGSQMAIRDDGEMVGSVSGGCVEGAVVDLALQSITSGQVHRTDFGISDDLAWEVGLACGGKLEVLIEPVVSNNNDRDKSQGLNANVLSALAAAIVDRRALTLCRDLDEGIDQLIEEAGGSPQVQKAIRQGKAQFVQQEEGDGTLFVQPFLPGPRLLIVGAVHIAQALAQFAATMGFDVKLIDPRGLFASETRFPDVEIVPLWPNDAFRQIGLDESTAVVCLSHDAKLDDPALISALRSERPVAYIGALGSKRTTAKRAERLRAEGFTENQVDQISAPIGLDIGSVSPAEIAISIAAEIIQAFRQERA